MFLNIFATFVLVVQIFADEKATCTTPSGETRECILLKDCPVLFDAFTNPREEDVEYLSKFICSYEQSYFYRYPGSTYQGIWVCCGTTPNITLRPDNDLTNLSDIRACGYQHRDDYFSEDHSIAIDEFPWLAAIIARNYMGKYDYTICGGVLINERYALTSAICAGFHVGDLRGPKNDTDSTTDCVYLPQFDLHECTTYEDYYIEEDILHPLYQHGTFYNNIALIKLNRTVTFTDYIRPIRLPIPGITLAKPNDTLYVTGLGDTQQIKKKIETKLITDEECKKYHDPKTISKNIFCTQHNDNAEITGYGDEGSPAMFRDKRHQWHIEGILLDGTIPISTNPLLRVSRYLPWIQDNMEVCYIKNSQDTFIKRFC